MLIHLMSCACIPFPLLSFNELANETLPRLTLFLQEIRMFRCPGSWHEVVAASFGFLSLRQKSGQLGVSDWRALATGRPHAREEGSCFFFVLQAASSDGLRNHCLGNRALHPKRRSEKKRIRFDYADLISSTLPS